MDGAPPPAPPPSHQHLNDPSPLWFPGLLLLATDGGMNDSSSGAADARSNDGRRHASAYMKGGTNHSSNSHKRAMPSADNELALCTNLAHLDLRRVAESLSRQHHNGGSIGSVASTASTASSATIADLDDEGDDGSVNYGRMRKRRRHSRTHNAYGSHDFQGILQSLFQRGEDGNQPSTNDPSSSAGGVLGGGEGAPSAAGALGNVMEDLASPQHF
jgi:hypothetical protein